VVPGIYYQLLTVFTHCDAEPFPVRYMYAQMKQKTYVLHRAVFAVTHDLVPEFVPEHVMADLGR